jgi:predicted HTH transcriptional regulator
VSPIGQYIQGFRSALFEDLHTEFKSAKRFVTPVVIDIVIPYLSAFLNAEGGTLYYGIENNGVISGVKLTREVRDQYSLALDNAAHSFHPQLTNEDYKLEFKPVLRQSGTVIQGLYVIELTVACGKREEVYLTNKNKAYIKRDASIYALSPKDMMALYRRKLGTK